MRGVLAAALVVAALGPTQAPAGEAWRLGPRVLPAPAGASPELRAAVEATPQPDVTDYAVRSAIVPNQIWIDSIIATNSDQSVATRRLARSLVVGLNTARIAGVGVHVVVPPEVAPENRNRLFVHLHGGGYVFNGGVAGAREAVLIARRAEIPVISIDYRMPPADPYPAGLDDVVAVWRALIAERPAAAMALGGSSAGGGLALAAVMRFRELGLALPGAVYAGTPWADLTATGDSRTLNEGADRALVTFDGLLRSAADLYAAGRSLTMPTISPVYGDFHGFPPTYLVTGTRDLLLSDTVRVHRRLREAGVEADLNVYEGMSHADYSFLPDSPESAEVYRELGAFLRKHLR